MKRMGLTPEDLENINSEMMQAFGGAEELEAPVDEGDEDDEESGKTATFPFLNRLFNNLSLIHIGRRYAGGWTMRWRRWAWSNSPATHRTCSPAGHCSVLAFRYRKWVFLRPSYS